MDDKKGTSSETKMKYIILAIAAVLVVAVTITVVFFSTDSPKKSGEGGSITSGEAVEEAAGKDEADKGDFTPVFKYFVSKSDAGYDDYMKVIDELKAEYGERVTFDIVDVDENPEAKSNFPVDGQTPVLIMSDTLNNICAIDFQCGDKDKLTEDIEKGL